MKKVSYCLLGLMLSSALLLSASFAVFAAGADGKTSYNTYCVGCHKDKLAGKDEKHLLSKFAYYADGNFTSGGKKRMKDIFMKMSAADKTALAKYINGMK